MLHPYASHQGLDADGLREVVALRDQSIKVTKINQIRLSDVNRQVVMVDDDNTPQPIAVIAKYLKAPASFLASADIVLAQHIVDHQFRKVKNKQEVVFRSGKAIGDQPAGSLHITGSEVVEKLIDGVGDVRRANFYDLGSYVDITLAGDKVTLKPKVNDITEGGLRCLYSELLARPPTLEPYVERLVCTNGMVCRDRIQAFQFDSMDDFLKQFDHAVEQSTQFVDSAIRAQLEKAVETKVERSEQAIRTIFANSNLNTRLLPATLAALTVEDDGSAFGVLQAVTRAANNVGYTHRLALQEAGAKEMARLETVHCPTCWSTLVH